jgi:hypothetical protein
MLEMEKLLASQIIQAIQGTEPHVKALGLLADKIADDEERRALRRQIAQVMGLYVDMMVAIFRQYPDLDPDPVTRRERRDEP